MVNGYAIVHNISKGKAVVVALAPFIIFIFLIILLLIFLLSSFRFF
jgi:hypothetical protein